MLISSVVLLMIWWLWLVWPFFWYHRYSGPDAM